MSTAPLYDKSGSVTSRGLTAALWRQKLVAYTANNPVYGYRYCDDFVDNLVGLTGTTAVTVDTKWTVRDAAAAGGTYAFANVAGPDGVAALSSTGTTNHFGVEASGPAVVTLPTATTSPRGTVVFQCRVDCDTADTVFVGLSEGGQFLSSTSQLPTTSDYIGFYTEDGGTTWTFVCANDNDGGTAVTDSYVIPASVIAASGYENLGFRVNIDKSVEVAVNGTWYGKVANGISQLALPIENLGVQLSATAGGGTTAPNINVDGVYCFVENSTD